LPKIVPIVEGDGEVTAVPLLLRNILTRDMRYDVQIAQPKNANGRGNLTKAGGLERFIRYAWKERDCGAILILLDAENECPENIARDFSRRAEAIGVLFPVVIVVAKRMFEAWILASISTIAGRLDLPSGLIPPADVEAVPNPKSWIDQHFPRGRAYKETQDQEAMTALMDLGLASSSRSFRRLEHGMQEALTAIDTGTKTITPCFR
jgi:hypothetical protein